MFSLHISHRSQITIEVYSMLNGYYLTNKQFDVLLMMLLMSSSNRIITFIAKNEDIFTDCGPPDTMTWIIPSRERFVFADLQNHFHELSSHMKIIAKLVFLGRNFRVRKLKFSLSSFKEWWDDEWGDKKKWTFDFLFFSLNLFENYENHLPRSLNNRP